MDGKIYAIPTQTVTPIIFYYNKELFDQAGAEPPATWDDLMSLTKTFNDMGVAPLSLGGQSRWTSMMWLEYLYDRVGGPEVFTAIYNGEPDAWSNPAAIQATTMIQDLVKADGFIKGFTSITADSNADQALLYTGKAANTVGNPAGYQSISSKASESEKEAAKKYFKDGLLTDTEIDAYIETGSVPIVKDIEDKLAQSDDSEFLTFQYELTKNAPNFQQSWDQALSPTAAEALLSNIDQLFLLSITPEEFADNMNATLGT